MRRKVILGVLCFITLFAITGCGDKTKEESSDTSTKGSQELTDVAEIGAFVDYPVSYSNVTTNFNSQITNIIEEDTTGWRILSIKNDEISIISTGVPLEYGMYYSKSNTEESVNNDLSNLNKVLNTNQTVKSEGYSFFTKSGFENNTFDLTKVFNTGLEDTSSVHAMTDEELITTYNALTNKELTIDDLYSTTTYLGNGSLKLDDDSKALDLLANGYEYYINGVRTKSTNECYLLYVSSGMLTYTRFDEKPIRIVLKLKSGVKVTGGNGTINSPYELQES